MNQKLKARYRKPIARGECHHYWLIETPTGRTSKGVCKSCGATKKFKNYFRDSVAKDNTLVLDLPDTEPGKLPDIESDEESDDI